MKLYEEIFDAVARIEEPADQALQHLYTVQAFFQHDQELENGAKLLFTETLKLVRRLKDVKQRLYLYGLCGIFLAGQGRFSEAFAIVDEIELLLMDPEHFSSNSWKEEIEDKKNLLFAHIAENQARHKQIDEALTTADKVTDFDEYEQTLLNIASQLEKGDFEAQTHLKVLEELESPEQIAAAYLTFAEICQKNAQSEKSAEFLQRALQKADTEIEDFARKDEVYSKAIPMLSTEQELESVLELIKSPRVRVLLLLQLDVANPSSFEQIITEARQIESDREKIEVFAQIGKALALLDRAGESRNVFREAIRFVDSQKNAFSKNDYQKLQSIFQIAHLLCESGERTAAMNLYKRAIKIVESVEDLYFRYNWFREISRNMLLDHFTGEALEIIDRFSYSQQDESDLNPRGLKRQSLDFRSFKTVLLHQESLARSQAAKILWEDSPTLAQEQIALATELAQKILDPIRRTEALREIMFRTGRN